jgi:Glycosyltransferase family 87
VGLPVVAIAPFVFPFAIAILFGNFDVLFPLLYGLMLLGALGTSLPARFGGGVGLAIAGIAKVHPATMGLWFVVRGLRDRRRRNAHDGMPKPAKIAGSWTVVLTAVAVGLVVLGLSFAVGGISPWSDYLNVLRSVAGAAVVDVPNVGPAAQLALLSGGGEGLARLLQIGVIVAALAGTAAVAWYRDDTLESFGWATVASLVILPVTWFHYPVALIPVALAAWLRADAASRRTVAALLAGAIAVGVLAVGLPVFIWLGVLLVLVAVRRSLPVVVPGLPFPTLEPSRISRMPVPGSRG